MNRAQRRAAGHRGASLATRDAVGVVNGVPVYDATIIDIAEFDSEQVGRTGRDSRVLLGIGPAGGHPVAYVSLCPCEGVAGLVTDLTEAAADAAPTHIAH